MSDAQRPPGQAGGDVTLPATLAEAIADFEFVDRSLRAEMLIEYADRFREVPPEIAARPFPEHARAPRCESEVYVFAVDRPDGTLDLHFAVENPQGLSAKAWAVILRETLSGQPLESVVTVPGETIRRIFGHDLSMGKELGLLGMLQLVQDAARARPGARRGTGAA
jgi:cysteine desulfuration protein SufE